MWIEPLGALLAAEDALRQPLGREARLRAEEEWRRAYFAALRAAAPGAYVRLGGSLFSWDEQGLTVTPLADSRRTA